MRAGGMWLAPVTQTGKVWGGVRQCSLVAAHMQSTDTYNAPTTGFSNAEKFIHQPIP